MAVELAQEDVCYGEMQVSRGKQVLAVFLLLTTDVCVFFFVMDICLYFLVDVCRFLFSYSTSADCLLLVVSFAHTVQDD